MKRSLLGAASLAAAFSLHAQTAATRLTPFVVSGDRTPEDPAALPSSVTSLDLPDLVTQGIPDLRTALAEAPGLTVVGSGAAGGQTSIFIRGANSDQTLFVVDGVRLSTPADSYANFLGAADIDGLDRTEVLLGPQSTLYGSTAMGGVVLLDTAHGGAAPAGDIQVEGGSFRTLRAAGAASGSTGGLDYSASLSHTSTDNQRPYNAFQAWNYSERLEDNLSPWLEIGTTFRGVVSHYQEPGPTPTSYPDESAVANDTHLFTAYAEVHAGTTYQSRLTFGWYQDQYTDDDGSPYDYYRSRNTREIAEWQNTWQITPDLKAIAGLDAEWSHNWAGALLSDRLLAEYALAIWHPVAAVEITAGLRHDAYSAEGSATTGRLGASYRLWDQGPVLRATYGTGFEAPTPGDRYGTPPYVLPNAAIRPERSRGWDAGLDQAFASGSVRLGATVFANRFTDLLEYQVVDFATYAGEEINVGRASSSGVELTAAADVTPMLSLHGNYTFLGAHDDVSGARLLRRPRHAADAVVEVKAAPQLTFGAGMRLVADNYDYVGYGAQQFGGYTTFRVFARYEVHRHLWVTARVENLLDRRYEEVSGYPALGRGIFAGLEWRY